MSHSRIPFSARDLAWSMSIILILSTVAFSCGTRSLIEVDVTGDTPFQGVTLRITAGGTNKMFPNVTFATDMPYKAGIYLSDSVSGSVSVVANAIDGAGHCIGAGQASVSAVTAGMVVGPVILNLSHTTDCTATSPDAGTGAGGATGAGGVSGGAGGAENGAGGSGAGGTNSGMGGGQGTGGTAGQPGGNLIANGDFSSGENSWAIKAGTGTVTAASGTYCVTVPTGNVSLTIGYPAGTTPPFQITGGVSYQLSYQASLSGGAVTLEAKVGQTLPNYDATGSDWMNEQPLGTTLHTFTHTFTRATTDSSMGVAFNLTGGPGTACFDNVSLTLN